MSVKTKTKKRIVLMVAAVVGVTAVGGGGWAYHLHRKTLMYEQARATGLRAAADNDPKVAVSHLALWLSRHPDDVDALAVYARERILVESDDNSHVWDTIARLRHLVELQPDADGPRRQLMTLYWRYGFTTECLDAANALLKKNKSDVEAVKYKVFAQSRLRRWEEARAAAEQWATLSPNDPTPHIRVLAIMAELNRPAAEIVQRGKAVADKDPNSPVGQVVLGAAYLVTGDAPSGQKMMRLAAAQEPPTPEFGRMLVDQLNRAALYDESFGLLRRLAKSSGDAETRAALLRRLWETSASGEVVSLTDQAADTLPAEAAALRALALVQLGKLDQAKSTQARLAADKSDTLAQAWSMIVEQVITPTAVDARKLLESCQRAAGKDSEGAYLWYFIGHAYAQLDEGDLAIEAWQRVATQNPTWSLPLIRLSEARLAKGRYAMAMASAQEALRRSPLSVAAAINLARVWGANAETSRIEAPEQLLNLIGKIRAELPKEEQTLGMQVALLANMKRTDEAKAEIVKAIQDKDAPGEATLIRLAAISRAYDLGLAEECFKRSEQAHGMSASLAYASAVHKFSRGAGPEGTALLKAAREKAADGNSLEWQTAWARYLEIVRDPGAKEAWVKLADANPSDRRIQQAALSVRSTRSDRDFTDRTIERLRKLIGDEGITCKLARARWVLEGAKSDQDLVRATVLLNEVSRMAPDSVEPRLLLAMAYERLNNVNDAVEQLHAAAAADPANAQVALQLSRLLQQRGEFDKAREELDRVAKGKTTDVAQRRQAAVLLAEQGDSKRAIDLLQQGTDDDKDGKNSLMLAMLYRQRNEMAKAEQVVTKLLETPDPVVVQFAADLYAQQGRRADADRVLAMLDTMKLKPGMKELMLADHACRYQSPDKAIELYRASLKAAPDNAAAWRSLIRFDAFLGRAKEMAETAEEGARAVPVDAALGAIVAQKELLVVADGGEETRPLVISYVYDARPDAPSLQAMRIIVDATRKGDNPEQTTGKLQKVADANPMYAPLQSILVDRYIRLNRTDEAARLAARAVQMFPNDPEPARLGVTAMGASQRWPEALAFARTWRERSLASPLSADMAISTCLIRTGQPGQAAQAVESYIPTALKNPDLGSAVILQYASALVADHQVDKAAEILWPLAKGSAFWQKAWMEAATVLPANQATQWLERVASVIPGDSEERQVALAIAWQTVGIRANDSKALARANALFDQLTARPNVTGATLAARGIAAEQNGDVKAAEAAYRRALSLDPNLVVAQNNLAMIIITHGGDVSEATRLAKAAAATQPATAAFYDTLAQVQAKGKDVDGAVASLRRALELEPKSLEYRVHLVRVLLDGGRRKEADRTWQEVVLLPDSAAPASPDLKQQMDQIRQELSKEVSATTR